MRHFLIISLLLVSACGRTPRSHVTVKDEGLKPHVNSFYTTLAKDHPSRVVNNTRKIMVKLVAELEEGVLGKCIIGKLLKDDQILISEAHWEILDEPSRRSLVWHELGHCFLYRNHVNEVRENSSCATSIMNAYLPRSFCLSIHEKSYTKELFKG